MRVGPVNVKSISGVLVIALTAILFYLTLIADAHGILKFLISLVLLAGCGLSLQVLMKIDGEYGLLLLKTKKGLHYIDVVAKKAPRLWQACADFGTVIGFGISSLFFFKKVPKKTFMFSIFALIIVSQTMTAKIFTVVTSLINIPIDFGAVSEQAGGVGSAMPFIVIFAMLFFGFCGITVVGLILNTYSILSSIFNVALGAPGADLSKTIPGASPIIPGINMPLMEGILALALLLFVHEVSHGILSRIGNIKLESAGLLLFGILPVGAFVDPDEKSLSRKDLDTQTRVFSAGSASNLILFIISFFVLTGFEMLTAPQLDPSVYIYSVEYNSSAYNANITSGEKLLSIDGFPLTRSNLGQIQVYVAERDSLTLETGSGTHLLEPKENPYGRKTIGISIQNEPRYLPEFGWLGFFRNTIGLVFVLNFLVGVINLIPMFMAFDGYRILALHAKSGLFVKIVSYSLLAMLLLNFAPWLWL